MLKNEKPKKEGAKKWKALKEDLSMEATNMKDWSDENDNELSGEDNDDDDEEDELSDE